MTVTNRYRPLLKLIACVTVRACIRSVTLSFVTGNRPLRGGSRAGCNRRSAVRPLPVIGGYKRTSGGATVGQNRYDMRAGNLGWASDRANSYWIFGVFGGCNGQGVRGSSSGRTRGNVHNGWPSRGILNCSVTEPCKQSWQCLCYGLSDTASHPRGEPCVVSYM